MSPRLHRLWTPALLLVAAASVILPYLLLAASASTASFTPDSWAFRALADSVFQDFYRYATLRSFDRISDYSWSFPPLWPVVLAVAGRVTSNRPETGVLLACAFALLTALPVAWIFRQTLRRRVLVVACTVTTMGSLLLFTRYFEEVAGARAVPLSVFLLLGAAGALLTLRSGGRWWSGPVLGLLLGLACLTRFDALPLAPLLLAASAFLTKGSWKHALVAIALFALTLSPWVYYSQTHFGTPWVSDNSSIAMSARNTRSNHYLRPNETLRSHPLLWVRKCVTNAAIGATRYVSGLSETPVTLACLAGAAALALRRRKRTGRLDTAWPAILLHGCALVGMAGVALTGYFDLRYFALAYVTLAIAIQLALLSGSGRGLPVRSCVCAMLAFQILAAGQTLTWLKTHREKSAPKFSQSEIAGLRQTPNVTVLGGAICHQFGAETGIRTVCLPADWDRMTALQRTRFLTQYRVTHVLAPGDSDSWAITQPVHWRLVSSESMFGTEYRAASE